MKSIYKYNFVLISCSMLSCSNYGYKTNLAQLQNSYESIGKIIQSTIALNEVQYNYIEMALLNDPVKVRKDYNRAIVLRKCIRNIFSEIEAIKKSSLAEVYGNDSTLKDFSSKKHAVDYSDFEEKIYKLKNQMDSLYEFCKNSFSDPYTFLRDTMSIYFANDLVKEKEEWAELNFNTRPLIAFLCCLDNIKLQILQSEYLVLNYLFTKNDDSNIRFSAIDAYVIAESNIIGIGQKYKAEIFLAARDTSMRGTILFGKVAPTNFKIIGKADTLKVINGVGKYISTATKPGNYNYSGIYILKDSLRGDKYFPFELEYKVIEG